MKKRIAIIAAAAVIIAAAGVGVIAYFFRGGSVAAMNVTQLSVGEKYLTELKYEQATATLQQVITVEPNNTEAYLALSRAYRYMGDIDTARETLESGYNATNSAVIEREINMLTDAWGGAAGSPLVPDTQSTATVEIAGRYYPADSTELVLRDCGLGEGDMQKLSEFTNLERLDISGNGITDISVVGNLVTLKKFYAANNAISDVSALAGLPAIEYIGLRGNQITDADKLFALGSLRYLHLSGNQISYVPGIGGNLQLLYLADNNISDVSAVTGSGLLYCDIDGNGGR